MRRSYKYLLRPTARQADALAGQLTLNCEIYNAALQERRDAWRMARKSVTFAEQCRQLTEVRREREDVGAVNAHSCQQTLRRLDRAFQAFFRRVKAGQTPGFPRFKPQARFDSITFPSVPDDAQVDLARGRVSVRGAKNLRVHLHRRVPDEARIKTVTIKREGCRWYVVLSCDDVLAEPLERTGAVTGIDLGVASLLTTSEGEHVPNPRHGETNRERLTTAQRALSRCKRGSARRRKVKARVAASHRKVRNQRRDAAHKVALDLVQRHDVIVHEALRVANMTRSAKGTADDPGTNVAAKSGLNRSILDAGWGEFLGILHDKAESAGREVIAVDPRNTSHRCAQCGHTAAENRVTQEAFRCQSCGHEAHADVNAAINILRAGLARREECAA